MDVFNFDGAAADMRERAEAWSQPLRMPAMSVGVYLLAADSTDDQTPHHEDEKASRVAGVAPDAKRGRRWFVYSPPAAGGAVGSADPSPRLSRAM